MKIKSTFNLVLALTFTFSIANGQSKINRLILGDSLSTLIAFDSITTSAHLNTHLLWDKITPNEDFLSFQGHTDCDSSFGLDGFQVYQDLKRSAIDTSNFITYDSLKQLYQSQELGFDALPIMTFAYDYQYLKPEALDSGYVNLHNGKLIADPTRNPFNTNTVWLGSIRYAEVPNNESFKVVFPGALFFKNPNSSRDSIFSLEADFADGSGYRIINFNQPMSISYSGEGGEQKVVTLKWNTSSGTKFSKIVWKTAKGCAGIPAVDKAPWPDLVRTVNYATVSWTPNGINISPSSRSVTYEHLFEASIPYAGKKAAGKAYIRYRDSISAGQRNFNKPIIFVEGLDLAFAGSGAYTGLELIQKDASYNPLSSTKIGNTGWPQLWGCNDDSLFTAATPYLDSLSAEGYDIIMLDFWDGADYMQRNAFLLVELIQRINNHKIGNEPNVIIGASMGGQIARYALTYMEHNNMPHCTRLNVSFDSPWNGAHIPLALQAFLEYQAYQKDEVEALETLQNLHRPAPKQLLNYHIWKAKQSHQTSSTNNIGNKTITWNFNHQLAACPERDVFLQQVTAMGDYPQTCRNIAIVNGNMQGKAEFPAGQQFIDHNNDQCVFFEVQNDLWAGNTGISNIAILNTQGAPKYIYRVQNMQDIYNAPASIRNNFQNIYEGVKTGLTKYLCQTNKVHLVEANSGFIPSVSALYIDSLNWHFKIDNVSEFSPSLTGSPTFDSYFAPAISENHVQTTDENMGFFLNEIRLGENLIFNQNGNNLTKTWNNPLERSALTGIDINNGGKLYLNANLPYNDGTNQSLLSPNNSLSRVFLGSDCNPSKEININNGGTLELGADDASLKKAYLYIENGAKVNLNSGGQLTVNAGSKIFVRDGGKLMLNANTTLKSAQLIIEPGAELIYDAGANIQLQGPNAELIIKGKLTVKANATLGFSGQGKLVFDQDIPWITGPNGQPMRDIASFLDIESGAKLHLIGTSASQKGHTLLEVRKTAVLKDADNDIFTEIRIQNGAIEIAPQAFLFTPSPLTMHSATVRCSDPSSRHNGLRIWNHSGINHLNDIKVKHGMPGIMVSGPGASGHTHIRNAQFEDNYTALQWNSGYHMITNSTFTNNIAYAIQGQNLNGRSSMVNLTIQKANGPSISGTAIELQGQKGSSIQLNGSTLGDYAVGLDLKDIDLRALCNVFEDNLIGIQADNSVLYLNEQANNTFRNNETANLNLSGNSPSAGIYLLEGHNLFDLPLSNNSIFEHVKGSFDCNAPYSDYLSNGFLDFNFNQFQASPSRTVASYFDLTVSDCGNPNLLYALNVDVSQNNSTGPNCNLGGTLNEHPTYTNMQQLPSTSGKLSFGSVYVNTPIEQAMDQALSQLSYGEFVGNDLGALNDLINVLNANVSTADSNTAAYLDLAYRAMHQSLNQAYQGAQLSHNEGEPNPPVAELSDVIAIVDDWLLGYSIADSSDHAAIFQLNLDKVHAYRVAGHYSEALAIISAANTWTFDYTQSQRAAYWDCVCDLEDRFFREEIPAEEFDYGLNQCQQTYAGFAYKRPQQAVLKANTEITDQLEVFPQPTSDFLEITSTFGLEGDYQIIVRDLQGRTVLSTNLSTQRKRLELDVQSLKPGLYLLSLAQNQQTRTIKFMTK